MKGMERVQCVARNACLIDFSSFTAHNALTGTRHVERETTRREASLDRHSFFPFGASSSVSVDSGTIFG